MFLLHADIRTIAEWIAYGFAMMILIGVNFSLLKDQDRDTPA